MRDTNTGMIELRNAFREENGCSSLIRHQVNGEFVNLRFAIHPPDYGRLKSIVQFRPFEDTGVAPYRYFFPLSYLLTADKNLVYTTVRVEQLNRHKQFEFEVSRAYMANLLWISQLTDAEDIRRLIVPEGA